MADNTDPPVCEFWVMRVMLHPGFVTRKMPVRLEHMDDGARAATLALVIAGGLCCLPDGCICEPVEVFERQLDADAHRETLAAKHPGDDFRVVLNTNIVI